MSKETRNVIIVAAAIGIAVLAFLIAWGLDEISKKSKRHDSKEKTEVVTTSSTDESAAAPAVDSTEVVEYGQTSASTGSGAPSSPECTVSGNISGYGQYELEIHDSWGQICPGVPGREGQLNDVVYDSSTGELTMSAYTETGDYCGNYHGYLSLRNGRYVYEGTFCNTSGKERSFTMTSR